MEKFPVSSRQREKTESQERDFSLQDIESVETAKGSSYRYLPDGTTQRFKRVEGKDYEPQSVLVYVPNYEWFARHAPPSIREKLGENESMYTQTLLEYVQNPREEDKKVYIVDKSGKKLETNEQVQRAEGLVYLVFLTAGKTDFSIPVSHKPKVGFMTFDTRKYKDEKTGEYMRERHLGNKVVKINLKKQGGQ